MNIAASKKSALNMMRNMAITQTRVRGKWYLYHDPPPLPKLKLLKQWGKYITVARHKQGCRVIKKVGSKPIAKTINELTMGVCMYDKIR